MTRYTINNRWTGAALFEGDFDTMALCVTAAVKARANLAGACLAGADLAGANLAGACLADADLAGAYLADADLARADLAGADLAGAYLAGACLADADLARANLAGACLADADLARAKWSDGFTLNRAPVRAAQRGDGYTFYLLDTNQGWRISAGCRFFTPDEAWAHWERTRPEDAAGSIGAETRDILTMFELAMEREPQA